MGLTYEQLSERMQLEGVSIHQSAIQKTEKSGRRVSIDEMVAYAKIFGIPVEELWGGTGQDAELAAGWQALIDAETLSSLMEYTQRKYGEMLRGVQEKAGRNAKLKGQIESRLENASAVAERRAREMAEKDGEDISTPELFEAYLWGHHADSSMIVARDVLTGLDNGE